MTKIAPFDIILIDPPWPFRVWEKKTGSGRSAERHYKGGVMTLDDIYHLDIQGVAAKNFAVALWVTWPHMMIAPAMCFALWGVTYRTRLFTWAKLNKMGEGFFIGNGYYARANDEVCLLAARGSVPRMDKGVRSLIAAELEGDFDPRLGDIPTQIVAPRGRHSEKPVEAHERIERLWPEARKLELFARQKRPGWTCLGDEITGRDIREDLARLKKRIAR